MRKKINKQDIIEGNNLLEEASELMGPCISCGLCKSVCPLFKATKDERISGRGQAIMLQKKIISPTIFQATLDLAEETVCPRGVKMSEALRKAREAAVLLGKGIKSNEELVENMMAGKNPY